MRPYLRSAKLRVGDHTTKLSAAMDLQRRNPLCPRRVVDERQAIQHATQVASTGRNRRLPNVQVAREPTRAIPDGATEGLGRRHPIDTCGTHRRIKDGSTALIGVMTMQTKEKTHDSGTDNQVTATVPTVTAAPFAATNTSWREPEVKLVPKNDSDSVNPKAPSKSNRKPKAST